MLLIAKKKKDLKVLNNLGKYVTIVSLNEVDDRYANIEVTDNKRSALMAIEPSLKNKEVYDEITEIADSVSKKRKRKKQVKEVKEKFIKKYKKQLKKSLDVDILLYTVTKSVESGKIVIIDASGLNDKYQQAYLNIFNKYIGKTFEFDISLLRDLLVSLKDEKKKKRKKIAKKAIREISEIGGEFCKETFKKNSIHLTVAQMLKTEDIKIDGELYVTKENSDIQIKRKILIKTLQYGKKNNKKVSKLIKNAIKKVKETNKRIKTLDDFVKKADKKTLVLLIIDIFISLNEAESE